MEQVEKFVKKELDYGNWIQKRTVKKESIDVGDWIDVRDTEFIWCQATVLDIFPKNCEQKSEREAILVHYVGWANIFNEIIGLDSKRLSNHKFYTSRVQIPHYNLSADNPEHFRSPVVTGEYNPPAADPIMSDYSDSFVFEQDLIQSSHLLLNDQNSISSTQSNAIQTSFHRRIHMQRDAQMSIRPLDRQNININQRLSSFVQRYGSEFNYQLGIEQTLQDDILQNPNRSTRPVSMNERHNLSHPNSIDIIPQTQPRRNLSQVHYRSLSQRPRPIHTRPQNSDSPQLDGLNLNQINFVDSLEIYSRYDPNLRDRLGRRNQAIRRPNQYGYSNTVSLRSQDDGVRSSSSQSSVDYNGLQVEDPNFSMDELNLQKNFEGEFSNEQGKNKNPFLEMYFENCEHLSEQPFIIDIEQIENNQNQIAHEIKKLGKEQKEMQTVIQAEEQARKQDIEKWNKLNKLLDNYYSEAENPEGEMIENALLEDYIGSGFELQCLAKQKIGGKIQEPSLEDVLNKFNEKQLEKQKLQDVHFLNGEIVHDQS